MTARDGNSMVTKVELASPDWIELAGSHLLESVASLPPTAAARFSLCEVFTQPPAHLDDGSGAAAWWLAIDGRTATFGAGRRDDVDLVIELDYEQSLPGARLVHDLDDPEVARMLAERAERSRAAARAEGREPLALPPELSDLLRRLHNHLAVRTR